MHERIKQLRQEKGFTQEMFAQRLNVVRQTVSKWEKGLSVPDSDILLKIAEVLEVSVSELLEEPPVKAEVPTRQPRHKSNVWLILLLILGAPVWLSLLIAVAAVALSLYIAAWAILLSLFAVTGALAITAVYSVLAAFVIALGGHMHTGLALLAAGAVCAGICIPLFLGCFAATKGFILLTKKLIRYLVARFAKREAAV